MILGGGLATTFLAGCDSSAKPPTPATTETSHNAVSSVKPTISNAPPATRKKPSANRLTTFPFFQEVAKDVGVSFTYLNGATGKVLMVEATGGGAGWIDYDNDGLLDIYLCQGGDPASNSRATEPNDQLFRQVELNRFVAVTDPAAVVEQFYSQGVAVGDFDDDGFDDIFVTNVGGDTLFHNRGDGTFSNVTAFSKTTNPLWSSSAAWGDLDGDGDLDLYVCNYVDYDPYHPIPCGHGDVPGTCHPREMTAVPDECYFNQGDGTFRPEAHDRGLFGPENKALAVVIADLNNDGLPDVYVTNDTTPNFLFVNQGNGQFVESANILGCAVSRDGLPQASMGVAFGDFDRNGWFDLYCTHFTHEAHTLYKNLGSVGFQDVTGLVGLNAPTLPYLGFGTVMTDFNQDGHEDIFVTHGHIDDWRNQGDLYQMIPQLFSFEGPRFVECTSKAGDFFAHEYIGRGVAKGDFDGDGDWDLAVVHQNAPTAILRNDSARGNWLKLRLIAKANRRGWGTRVTLEQGETKFFQELAGGTSYASAHESALIFGVGQSSAPVRLVIRWPDGDIETVEGVALNRAITLRQSHAADALITEQAN